MKEAPVIQLNHPVLGSLANDQWDRSWLFLRPFPSFAELCWADSNPGEDGGRGEVTASERVARWREQGSQLLRDNGFQALAELHSLGVFTVTLDIGAKVREPAPHQVEAFQAFAAAEASLCEKVLDALWRYYQDLITGEMADLFGDDDWQVEQMTGREQLPEQVEFSGLDIPRCHAHGLAPLLFDFRVRWEQEHGFYIIAHEGEVIGIGDWDAMNDLTVDPQRYDASRRWMNASEVAALERYITGFEEGDEKP